MMFQILNIVTTSSVLILHVRTFVISFITGALIGSAVGLFYKNKAEEKIDGAKTKEKKN